MNFGGLELCCPVCREDLAESNGELVCRACERNFPVIAGIPDLRVFPDPYISMEEDRKKGELVAARAERETFASLLDYYYGMTSVVPPKHARTYKRGLLMAPARAAAALETWEQGAYGFSSGGCLLDIGCGTGPLLVAAAQRGYRVAGVDIAFRWLVVAKKRLSEEGLNVPLVCACAEALPLRSEAFDRVSLDSTIEMVADQGRVMQEAHRVLAPEGRLFVATPNRFSLGPDPHIGVPAGGILPKSWIAALARRQGAIPPVRNLLWSKSLARLIWQAGFDTARIDLPRISDAQMKSVTGGLRAAMRLYRGAQQIPFARPGLLLAGPLLYATAQKPAVSGRAR